MSMSRSMLFLGLSFCSALTTLSGGLASGQDGIAHPWFVDPNPVVRDSGRFTTGSYSYGWFGLRRHTTTHRDQARVSAFDPDRAHVDPGSVRRVDEWVPDGRGGYCRQHGHRWTSNGVPHGDITTSQQHRSWWGFRTRRDDTRVAYSR